jgi:hypothetical protein
LALGDAVAAAVDDDDEEDALAIAATAAAAVIDAPADDAVPGAAGCTRACCAKSTVFEMQNTREIGVLLMNVRKNGICE